MKFIYVVIYAFPPTTSPVIHKLEFGPTSAGGFETQKEAEYAASKLLEEGIAAWVMQVQMGKYTKAQMKKGKKK